MVKKNVGFIYYLHEKNLSGINKYSKGILAGLVKYNQSIALHSFGRDFFEISDLHEMQSMYSYESNPDMAMKEWYLLADMSESQCVHSFYYPILFQSKNFKTVLTIHDLSPLTNINWFNGNQKSYDLFDIALRRSAKQVDHIIAVSESTKHDVMDFYGIPEEKISIASPAVSYEICRQIITGEDVEAVRDKFQIDAPYILSVCTLEPRKNLPSLLKAFELYKERHGNSDIKLVLTGRLGWQYDNTLSAIRRSCYAKDIILTDYVTEQELAVLFKAALAFAYISYYEGFGIPILEALHMGKAVLASNTTSMPEVGGNAVCYCDPYDMESIYSSLEKLLEDRDYRRNLEIKAKEQAGRFSYEKSAGEIVKVYEKIGVLN